MENLGQRTSITLLMRNLKVGQTVEVQKSEVLTEGARKKASELNRIHQGAVEFKVSDIDARNTPSFTVTRVK